MTTDVFTWIVIHHLAFPVPNITACLLKISHCFIWVYWPFHLCLALGSLTEEFTVRLVSISLNFVRRRSVYIFLNAFDLVIKQIMSLSHCVSVHERVGLY